MGEEIEVEEGSGSSRVWTSVNALWIMMSAAFSAIMTVGAPVWPPGILGITEESAIRIPEIKSVIKNQVKIKQTT